MTLGVRIALGFIALVFVALIAFSLVPSTKAPAPVAQVTLPTAGSASQSNQNVGAAGSLTVQTGSGTSLETRDFLTDPATVSDLANPGYYYLGYHTSTGPSDSSATDNPPYIIEYIAATHYFNITLLKEPLGQTRTAAEQYLLTQLGISAPLACTLKYMVSVPESVNAYYASQNLGFSFCPGAVQLPT